MKANEAPEKIYIPTILAANVVRYKEEGSIEYVRTDAFIEKACDWLKNNASNYIIEHPFSSDVDFEEDKMIEDFEEYLKK